MKPEEIRQNVQLEKGAGEEALYAAKTLLEKGLYRSAMSRLYYGFFHHIKALLYTLGLEPKRHEGLEDQFGFYFVKPGKINPAGAKLLARLQKYRERSDYGLVTVFTKEDVAEEMKEVQRFLKSIQSYLE